MQRQLLAVRGNRSSGVITGWLCASLVLLTSASTASATSPAQALVLQSEDLPGTFAIAGGDHLPTGGYLAVFLRPSVLASTSPEGALLGVMASVELETGSEDAHTAFLENAEPTSIRRAIGQEARGEPIGAVQTLGDNPVESAQESVAFRLEYRLAGVHVVEYRFRLRMGRAVANVIISGRTGSDGQEPAALENQARSIASRQAQRLAVVTENE